MTKATIVFSERWAKKRLPPWPISSASNSEKSARARETPVLRLLLTADELGHALGRTGPRSVAAVGPGKLGRSLRKELLLSRAYI